MTPKRPYSAKDIQSLTWDEHIRKRPAMYLGRMDQTGFLEALRDLLSFTLTDAAPDEVALELTGPRAGRIRVLEMRQPVNPSWGRALTALYNRGSNGWLALNALSTKFAVQLSDGEEGVYHYRSAKGKSNDTIPEDADWTANGLEATFSLDPEIWGDGMELRPLFLLDWLREFAYLHAGTTFRLSYRHLGEPCQVVFRFDDGLADLVVDKGSRGLDRSFLPGRWIGLLGDFEVELAFAFRGHPWDVTFLDSWALDRQTSLNGSHVRGLIDGLLDGIKRYRAAMDAPKGKVPTVKRLVQELQAAIQVRSPKVQFAGPTREKLDNPELCAPLRDQVSGLLFDLMRADPDAANRLLGPMEWPESNLF